jgi:non-specific serine/threonine protein kinase
VRPYVLRRLKTDRALVPELPDKTECRAYCSLGKVQAALYQEAVDRLARELETKQGIERKGLILATLLRLKQICNHPSQWLGDGVYDPHESGKFARLGELAGAIADSGERALVFTQFREMTEPLARFLAGIFGRPGLVLTGATEVAERRALVEAFQAPAGPPFFVLSLRAGGVGLNLTAASHVIHFDRWWNPAVENQATDRAHRIGQRRNVLVHKLVCRGTIEERVDELIESKRSLATSVVESGGEVFLTELGREDLLALVSLDARAALTDG